MSLDETAKNAKSVEPLKRSLRPDASARHSEATVDREAHGTDCSESIPGARRLATRDL